MLRSKSKPPTIAFTAPVFGSRASSDPSTRGSCSTKTLARFSPLSSPSDWTRNGTIAPRGRTSETFRRPVHDTSGWPRIALYSPMRTTASERSELSTTPRTTSPTVIGASQSSRCTVGGNSPSLRTVAVGGVNPRALRSSRSRPWRSVWLAASCIDVSSVV